MVDTLRLLGYVDRLRGAPGERLRFMVSSEVPEVEVALVRLLHGDVNPAGPGFREVEVPSSIDGTHRAHPQAIRSGSRIDLPDALGPGIRPAAFATFLWPTMPADGDQTIAASGDPGTGPAWWFGIGAGGGVTLIVSDEGGSRIAVAEPLRRFGWYHVGFSVDADGHASVWQYPVRRWPRDASGAEATGRTAPLPAGTGDLWLGGTPDRRVPSLDGKLDRPRLYSAPLDQADSATLAERPDDLDRLGEALLGAWDFAADIPTDRVTDRSPAGRHGTTVNMPTRAVTGYNHRGHAVAWTDAPDEYGAIHFHRDDLDDAGWEPTFELLIPADLPSGVYAARLRASGDEDHIPFVVRPPRGTATTKVAVLMPTLTYVMYANYTDLGKGAWQPEQAGHWSNVTPHADPTLFPEVYRWIDEHQLYGNYDLHVDGSGVVMGSWLRPILNMRPRFRYRIWGAPPRFPADLYLIGFLDAAGFEVDVITDHDLHEEGPDLLRPYAVVLSGSHPEYWTERMRDGLDAYLGDGGRFMYLGGNGLFGVATLDDAHPHRVELRRWGAPWPFECPPGERFHAMTGEQGGTWRNRGRAPNTSVGIGTSAAGFDTAVPYRRMEGGKDPRFAWVFEGIDPDALIGDHPNLVTRWGAAGYEIDRWEPEFGSPPSSVVLASSVGFSSAYKAMIDEELYFIPGRDGKHVDDPQVDGEPHRFVRADIAYTAWPNGGAAFAVGSIAWFGSLAHDGYRNTTATVTANVIRRFRDTPRGTDPA